eukprot:286287-Prorocentrum_minimum.AAC.1
MGPHTGACYPRLEAAEGAPEGRAAQRPCGLVRHARRQLAKTEKAEAVGGDKAAAAVLVVEGRDALHPARHPHRVVPANHPARQLHPRLANMVNKGFLQCCSLGGRPDNRKARLEVQPLVCAHRRRPRVATSHMGAIPPTKTPLTGMSFRRPSSRVIRLVPAGSFASPPSPSPTHDQCVGTRTCEAPKGLSLLRGYHY